MSQTQTLTPETAQQAECFPLGWKSYAQMQRDKRQYMRHCAKRANPAHAGGMLAVYNGFKAAREWDRS